MYKKIFSSVVAASVIVSGVPPVHSNAQTTVTESTYGTKEDEKKEFNHDSNDVINHGIGEDPYAKRYIAESSMESNFTESSSNEANEFDGNENEFLKSLNEDYQRDVQVGTILESSLNVVGIVEKATSLDKEQVVEVMRLIIDNYDSFEKLDRETLFDYVEAYAENSGDEKAITFLNKYSDSSNTSNGLSSLAAASTYDYIGAGNWAANNYNKYNTNYPAFNNWQSDCANFVSQAMHLGGGMAFTGSWYVYKKNSTYLAPTSATQLNYSWTLADPSPFISVVQFEKFWSARAKSNSMYSHARYSAEHKAIYNGQTKKGDIVVFHKGVAGLISKPYHLMIITGYDAVNNDFLMSGHSNMRKDYPLLKAIDNFQAIQILKL